MAFLDYGAPANHGLHADDAACLVALRAYEWDTNGDGTGDPQDGAYYYNTTDNVVRTHLAGNWVTVPDHAIDATHTVGTIGVNNFPLNVGGTIVSSSAQNAQAGVFQATTNFRVQTAYIYPNIAYGDIDAGALLLSSGLDGPLKIMIRDRTNGLGEDAIVLGSGIATGTACVQDVLKIGFWDIAGTTFYPLSRFVGTGDFETNIGINDQLMAFRSLTEETTIAAAATTDTTITIPQYAQVYAVSVRVTTLIPTAATFTVGTAATADLFSGVGRTVAVAAGTTDPCTAGGLNYFNAVTAVRITPNVAPAANTGRVRVTIHYIEVTPPTS